MFVVSYLSHQLYIKCEAVTKDLCGCHRIFDFRHVEGSEDRRPMALSEMSTDVYQPHENRPKGPKPIDLPYIKLR